MRHEESDNTKVAKPVVNYEIKLTPELLVKINLDKLREYANSSKVLAVIYDKDKADFYRNKLNMYNGSLFGPVSPTLYDPTTEEGQTAIDAAFNQTTSNAKDLVYNAAMGYIFAPEVLGVLPGARMISGRLSLLTPWKIGSGAEAIVLDNGTNVLKATTITGKEMTRRNSVPNTVKSVFKGKVKGDNGKLNVYSLKKVKVVNEKDFPKLVKKLDKAMEKKDFKVVNDPDVQYRAYTNGKVVVDDISPGNIGITTGNSLLDKVLPDFLKRPQIIDMSYLTVPEWTALGFKLKKGGKL